MKLVLKNTIIYQEFFWKYMHDFLDRLSLIRLGGDLDAWSNFESFQAITTKFFGFS